MLKLINDLLTSSQNILKKCEAKPSKFNISLKVIAESLKTTQFLWEISVKLQEIKSQEREMEQQNDEATRMWEAVLKKASAEDLEQFMELYKKILKLGDDRRPGRRTDLGRKRKQREATDRHRAKKKALANKDKPRRLMKRRKVNPKPDEPKLPEFDYMRHRLGMDNNPPPPQPKGWMGE
jgi:hypothetical protein